MGLLLRRIMMETPYKRNCPQCGKELTYVYKWSLVAAIKRNSVCKKCGDARNFQDLTGKTFDKWKVIQLISKDKWGNAIYQCQCKCPEGTIRNVIGSSLKSKTSRSCGCSQQNVELRQLRSNIHKGLPYQWIFTVLKKSANERGLEVGITFEEFLEYTKIHACYYCGDTITWLPHRSIMGKKYGSHYNIDRKDNGKGYTKENCVVSCAICNTMKWNIFTYEEMLLLGKVVAEIKRGRKVSPD
jgi:hypothetical protein